MPNISYILNKPHNENVSLSYVGGLLYPGTTDNSLLMSYYIDWCIKFDDSELIHTTTDFVNYLLRKIDELTERVNNLENNAPVPVTGISISNTPLYMNVGDTYKLTVLIAPANATNTNVTWSSSDTSIATVSNTGSITAKSTGTVKITVASVSNPLVKDTCNIIINKATQKLLVSADPSTIEIDGTTTATVSGNKTPVTWSSSDTNIATVDSNTGVIIGKAVGTATITATAASNAIYNEGKGTVSIKVNAPSKTYYYYYGIQEGTVQNPSSPINASNYMTLAETSSELKESLTIDMQKGYAYVLVPNTVTEIKAFDLTLQAYSTMKFNVIDTSIPGHLVYRSEKPFSGGNARLDFTY